MVGGAGARGLSRPRYKVRHEQDVTVAMRDGTRVALSVWHPEAAGRFPALYAASPYCYEFDDVPAVPLFAWRETGPIAWYVARGYAYVHADVRGSGRSEGLFRYMADDEQMDNVEVIAWIARQPWCDGNVGGIGQSYFGTSQWFMAAMKPPALKCIAPYDASTDSYRGSTYHGGILCGYRSNWYNNTVRANNLHRPADVPRGREMTYDLNLEILRHSTYDAFWKERTVTERLGDIRIPVFSIGHWGKRDLHLRGNLLGYELVRGPKKLLVTGAANVREAHHLYDTEEFHAAELLPFYDRYLKGLDTGWEKVAPVRLHITGEKVVRAEREFPLRRAKYTPWYLRKGPSRSVVSLNDGALAPEPPRRNEGSVSYAYPDPEWKIGVVAIGPDGRPDPVRRVLTFTSAPLAEDMEVTGPILLELRATSDQIDTDFIVKLSDQAPQPDEARARGAQPGASIVSKGWLRASHHWERDPRFDTRFRPYYAHERPRAIEPGTIYRFDIELMAAAHLFRKGHRIRLEIANADSNQTDGVFAHPYHPTKLGRDTIHHNAAHPSCLWLPVVPRQPRADARTSRTARSQRGRKT
jgi:hypothetical protein